MHFIFSYYYSVLENLLKSASLAPPLLNVNTDLTLKSKPKRRLFRMWPCPSLNPNFLLFLTLIPHSKQINIPISLLLLIYLSASLSAVISAWNRIVLSLPSFFSSSLWQLIPTGPSGLKLSLASCGRLSYILWDEVRGFLGPFSSTYHTEKSLSFSIYLPLFPSRSWVSWGQSLGFADHLLSSAIKVSSVSQLFGKRINEYLHSASLFLFNGK